MSATCHDNAARFVYILTRGRRNWLGPEDFIPLVQDVVETHPGLTFLKEATEFHSRYVHTVIARIFYCVNRSWSGRVTIPELRRSNLLNVIQILEEEEDINQVTQYFSYEHFYVIYCKFWELDRDHDLFIDKQDMQRHNDHGTLFLGRSFLNFNEAKSFSIFRSVIEEGDRQDIQRLRYAGPKEIASRRKNVLLRIRLVPVERRRQKTPDGHRVLVPMHGSRRRRFRFDVRARIFLRGTNASNGTDRNRDASVRGLFEHAFPLF